MRLTKYFATLAALAVVSGMIAPGFAADAKDMLHHTGTEIKKGAEKVGDTLKKGADKTSSSVKKEVNKLKHSKEEKPTEKK